MLLSTSIQKIARVCIALPALVLASITRYEVSNFGFPDGHVTEFQKAVATPLTTLSWALASISLLLIFTSFSRSKASSIGVPFLFTALVVVFFTTLFVVPWYFGSYLGLDNGMGG